MVWAEHDLGQVQDPSGGETAKADEKTNVD